ncbi:ZIP family metal transporter [Alkalimarinus coralli]|uniref:ZIP family metal transporter n=1 Tax=Alkalimarinus coralli TaxID=2935863 RepID=UPI00202B7495|nr:divalent cation transporter [Alkalimarinus coralli]
MNELFNILLLTLLAGLAMPFGAAIAGIERIRPLWLEEELRHSIIAFGGGALLSAVALVLVPEGAAGLSTLAASACFIAGGIGFMLIDIVLAKSQTSASQLTAMLADFVPESIALGSAFASGGNGAVLLVALIALQNLPEGFNAYRELKQSSSYSGLKVISLFTMMAFLGPLAAAMGYLWLVEFPFVVNGIMLFAAGGILYSVFQDIAPQAKLERHWAPAMGAVLGFSLGIVGFMLTHH